MPETPANILTPDSMVSTSLSTPVPLEAPDLPKEANLEEEKGDPAARDDLMTGA